MSTVIMRQKDIRPAPAKIEFKGMKFLITDRPSDVTIQTYVTVSFNIFFYSLKLDLLNMLNSIINFLVYHKHKYPLV